jgi:hypothetical protein
MNSSVACPPVEPVDVVSLRTQYMAAFERYREYVARLAEHDAGGEPPPIDLLEEERLTLQEFARMRAALLDALALLAPQIDAAILSGSRDESIRRAIAKRNDPNFDVSARKRRLRIRQARRARLVAVGSGKADCSQSTDGVTSPCG